MGACTDHAWRQVASTHLAMTSDEALVLLAVAHLCDCAVEKALDDPTLGEWRPDMAAMGKTLRHLSTGEILRVLDDFVGAGMVEFDGRGRWAVVLPG